MIFKKIPRLFCCPYFLGEFFGLKPTNQPTDDAAGGDFTNHNGTGAGRILDLSEL